MPVGKIISGGQTGADQGGLAAGKDLFLPTGGWMPKSWRTDEGSRPDLGKLYNLREHSSFSYPPRTELNVLESTGTLIFGNLSSPGCRLTKKLCLQHKKPVYTVWWPKLNISDEAFLKVESPKFAEWLITNSVYILNVAGNRENSNPGIHDIVRDFVRHSVRLVLEHELHINPSTEVQWL